MGESIESELATVGTIYMEYVRYDLAIGYWL